MHDKRQRYSINAVGQGIRKRQISRRVFDKICHSLFKHLKKHKITKGDGLYIGCGNGRNYIPLADSGLNILGIDVSKIATRQLLVKRPGFAEKIQHVDFADFDSGRQFDYIISIQIFQHGTQQQIFQHGTQQQIKKYFEKVSKMLKSGGLLFLRVNSVSTDIYFEHIIQQRNRNGGLTVRYTDGPKKICTFIFTRAKN